MNLFTSSKNRVSSANQTVSSIIDCFALLHNLQKNCFGRMELPFEIELTSCWACLTGFVYINGFVLSGFFFHRLVPWNDIKETRTITLFGRGFTCHKSVHSFHRHHSPDERQQKYQMNVRQGFQIEVFLFWRSKRFMRSLYLWSHDLCASLQKTSVFGYSLEEVKIESR